MTDAFGTNLHTCSTRFCRRWDNRRRGRWLHVFLCGNERVNQLYFRRLSGTQKLFRGLSPAKFSSRCLIRTWSVCWILLAGRCISWYWFHLLESAVGKLFLSLLVAPECTPDGRAFVTNASNIKSIGKTYRCVCSIIFRETAVRKMTLSFWSLCSVHA